MSQESDGHMVAELVAVELDVVADRMLAHVVRADMTRERRAYALTDDALFGLAYLVGVLQYAAPEMHERLETAWHKINDAWYRAFLSRDVVCTLANEAQSEVLCEALEVGV